MSNQPEMALMQNCYKYFHNTYPKLRNNLWRVENERKRTKYQQSIAKSTGLTSGVADFNLFLGGEFHAIELKANKSGKQSESQQQWQQAIEQQGGNYYIICSLDEFKSLIKNLIQ